MSTAARVGLLRRGHNHTAARQLYQRDAYIGRDHSGLPASEATHCSLRDTKLRSKRASGSPRHPQESPRERRIVDTLKHRFT